MHAAPVSRWMLPLIVFALLFVLVTLSSVTLSAADADSLSFTVQTASGTAATGPLLELGDSWCVRLGGAKPVHTEAGDLVELRQVGRTLPELPDGEQLLFVNGDRLSGEVLRLAGERLHFRPRLAGKPEQKELTPPLAALAVIWLAAPDGADHADRLRRRLLAAKRTRDVVHLRNGDVVEGVLAGLDAKNVQVEVERKLVEVKRERVAVIALNTELALPLRPKGAYGRLVLANGARLSLATAACINGKELTGTTLLQAPVKVPLEEVVALYVEQGKAVYFSELKPKQFEHTRYASDRLDWPYVADGSAAERDLRLGGSTHDRGLGLHSASRITYDLAGGYRRFEALVGLDDRTGTRGSVRVRVLVDGKPRDRGPDRELTHRTGPLPVRIDVSGAKELTLVVEFGRGGDVEDHVNWADARLIK